MEERIIEFANVLRRNGVRLSLSENMDAFRALQIIGITDPLLFRNALRTTLIKRAVDIAPFEELFNFFFLGIGQAIDEILIAVGAALPDEFLDTIKYFPL